MKFIVTLIRILVGALFIFSGFVKAIDPLGTSYKMHEYFAAFGSLGLKPFWDSMNAVSTPIAVFMIVVEMAAGLALLTGWKPKLTVWILYLMTLFFTLLTGFTYLSGYCPKPVFGVYSLALIVLWMLAAARFHHANGKRLFWFSSFSTLVYLLLMKYTDGFLACSFTETKMKVTDCGCFGDFLKLKPWETFWKDIALDVLIFILVIGVNHINPLVKKKMNNALIGLGTMGSLLFCFSNYAWGLPMVDFRPYKIGNNIRELRQPLKPEKREFVFVYKNKSTGTIKDFSMAELDQAGDDWEFVDRKDSIIDPGIPAKINNLFINDEHGNDITESLLADENYSLAVIIYSMKKTDTDAIRNKLVPLSEQCDKKGIHFYAVCGGDLPVDPFRHELQSPFPFYTADETPLKTMVRSNPGLILLKNGEVINMWHHRHFPQFTELEGMYFGK